MHLENITVILLLLAVVTALAEVADRVKVPYPVLLVLAGIGISLIPNLPAVQMSPEVMFLIFLPPALYSSAWTTSWPDFKSNIRSISLLAVGCVLFTTTVVAAAAHYVIPGFGWPESFVLGAIYFSTRCCSGRGCYGWAQSTQAFDHDFGRGEFG